MNKLLSPRASSSAHQINDDCLRVVCWLMRVPVKATGGQTSFLAISLIFLKLTILSDLKI